MDDAAIIIGGGISGFTTAFTLQSLGYSTTIYSDKFIGKIENRNRYPEFASLFPSASIIPHSVYADQLETLFSTSQSIFYELRKRSFPGITIHKHFEVFEFNPQKPDYCNWMPNFRPIEGLDDEIVPHRTTHLPLYGWVFDCLFADWPLYYPALQNSYFKNGGRIIEKRLRPGDIPELPASIIINCSGSGSPALFNDPAKRQLLLRGHLLQKRDAPLITNSQNEIISYNYTPQSSIYSDLEGNPCDIYCYPRKDGWYLGGSRQLGILDENGEWSGEDLQGPTCEINDYHLPRQIIELNREILRQSYGLTLDSSDLLAASAGFRYLRSKRNGLRLEEETLSGKRIIHNYGHGGAGVTLSWGCAVEIAKKVKPVPIKILNQKIMKAFQS
ncbi:MAG: FAD-dependent oxidoreductase [Balneolaceae bacterium]|jgi:hypothetical protein